MFNVDEKHFMPCNDHAGTFPPEKPRYTMTEEVEHTAREMRNTIDRLLKFEKRVEAKFEDLMKHLTSDNVIFKNTFSQAYNTFLMEVKNEVNTFEGNIDSSLALFKNDLESNYSTLSEDCRNQITEYYNQFMEELNSYKTELNETYDAFRDSIESRLEQHNAACVTSFNNYTSNTNSRIAEAERNLNAQYANFVNQVTATVSAYQTSLTALVDEQESETNDIILQVKTNLRATVEQLISDGTLETLLTAEANKMFGYKYFDITRLSHMVKSVNSGGNTYVSWSDAIAYAINFCKEKGMEIYFPEGIYYINETIAPLNGTVMKGATPSTSIIKVVPHSNINAINLVNCVGSGFTLRDICISGDYDHLSKTLRSTSGVGVYISAGGECDNITFENVVVENFAEHGFHITDQSWVIILSKCVIRRNKKYGLYLNKCSDNMFTNLAIYQNGYGGIYTYLGGNNKYSNLKVYLNSRDCENSEVESKYLAGISTNMTSLETFVNIEIQENYKHGFMIGGSSDYALSNILFDANGFENSRESTSRDLYIWGSRNIHGDIMLSSMKEDRGILDYRIFTSVNTKNINIKYYKNNDGDVAGSVLNGFSHITSDGTTEKVSITDGYAV